MRIVHWGRARRFYKTYPAAEAPLNHWKKVVQKSNWANFSDIRKVFASADWVKGKVIFNIKGNHYRLITIATFKSGSIYIKRILTHEEYDKGEWDNKRRKLWQQY